MPIDKYPAINDEVHLVTDEDLAKIYGTAERGQVVIGRLAGAESIPVRIDLDRLVTRHSAVLGSTGAGKSTTIASLLRAIAHSSDGNPAFPSTRILLLDIHGEYGTALKSIAKVFRVTPSKGEEPLLIPYWAIDTTELLSFLMGRLEARVSQEGQQTKTEQVYQYLTGPRFRHRVEAIVERFSEMQDDLNRERKATMRLWAKREAQIQGVIDSTVGMYGDLQGIAGRAMQEIPALETPLIESQED